MKKKNRNKKQGDLFNGFKPESEPKKEIITEKDVCRIFKGRVVSEKKAEIEARLIASGSWRKNVLEVENKIGNERGVYEWTLSGGEYYECQKVVLLKNLKKIQRSRTWSMKDSKAVKR